MPWLETAPMEQRERFIRDHQSALYTMADLSARYGISRKTGYKWLKRYERDGTIEVLRINRGGRNTARAALATLERSG